MRSQLGIVQTRRSGRRNYWALWVGRGGVKSYMGKGGLERCGEGVVARGIDDVRRKLEGLKPVLMENFKVRSIGVFGSYVRGEERVGERS